jgi:hypothetical protein
MSIDVPIDWASVNWGYVALLSAFTFIAALIANLVTFSHRLAAAILSALLFAVIFVAATYYPHNISLPTLTSRDVPKARPLPTLMPPQSGDAPRAPSASTPSQSGDAPRAPPAPTSTPPQ